MNIKSCYFTLQYAAVAELGLQSNINHLKWNKTNVLYRILASGVHFLKITACSLFPTIFLKRILMQAGFFKPAVAYQHPFNSHAGHKKLGNCK